MNDVSFRIDRLTSPAHKISQLLELQDNESEEKGIYYSSTSADSFYNRSQQDILQVNNWTSQNVSLAHLQLQQVGTSSFGSSTPPPQNSVKIFNTEAFCHICQKEFCNKYYLATHRASKHPGSRPDLLHLPSMLQSQLADFGLRGGDLPPQGLDLNQLVLASLDPSSLPATHPLRSLYLSQLAAISGGSPSPASSAPSSTTASETAQSQQQSQQTGQQNGGNESSNLTANEVPQMPPWFAGMMPQQAPTSLPSNMASLLEQLGGGMGLLGNNPMSALAAAFAQSGGQQPPLTPTSAANILGPFSTPQKDAYCSLCDKTFCNRYFLRTHMQKKHGIDDGGSPQKANSPQMGAFPFTLPPSTSAGIPQNSVIVNRGETTMGGDGSPDEKRARMEQDTPTKENTEADEETRESREDIGRDLARCNECDEKFESFDILQQHQLLAHGGGMARQLLSGLLPQGFPGLPFLGLPGGLPHGMSGMESLDLSNPLAGMQTPKGQSGQSNQAKRQYTSNGKNYCDLCNKEVCNKYFLRTHMLKMHGIVIDENKTIIANIDTLEKERMGALSFRCDICLTELKSRHLLRQHKQDVHGVVPLNNTPQRSQQQNQQSQQSTPQQPPLNLSGSAVSQQLLGDLADKCPVCETRLQPGTLALHIQAEHPNDLPVQFLAGFQQFAQQAALSESNAVACRFCPAKFKDEIECNLHTIQAHTMEFLSGGVSEQKKEEGVEKCNLCQYSTRNPRNMELHMERHERMNEAKATEDEDETLKLTQHVAFQMAQQNFHQNPTVSPKQLAEVLPVSLREIPKVVVHQTPQKAQCSKCNRLYSDRTALERHESTVHAVHAFCPYARRALRKRKILGKMSGARLSTKSKYPCEKCPQKFSTKEDCVAHVVRHLQPNKQGGKHEDSSLPHIERHSHTSGSLSPSGESLPEGFGRVPDTQKPFVMQTFIVRDKENQGHFLNEVVCHLPVRHLVSGPLSVSFDLIPTPMESNYAV